LTDVGGQLAPVGERGVRPGRSRRWPAWTPRFTQPGGGPRSAGVLDQLLSLRSRWSASAAGRSPRVRRPPGRGKCGRELPQRDVKRTRRRPRGRRQARLGHTVRSTHSPSAAISPEVLRRPRERARRDRPRRRGTSARAPQRRDPRGRRSTSAGTEAGAFPRDRTHEGRLLCRGGAPRRVQVCEVDIGHGCRRCPWPGHGHVQRLPAPRGRAASGGRRRDAVSPMSRYATWNGPRDDAGQRSASR